MRFPWNRPGRFRVLYFQSMGYAAMGMEVVFDADSPADAKKNYCKKVNELGYCCVTDGEKDIMEFERVSNDTPLTPPARKEQGQ